MNTQHRVAVCARIFAQHQDLRDRLESLYANVTYHESDADLKGEDLVRFLSGHHRAIVNLETIDRYTLELVPELRTISKFGVGLDMLDLVAMRDLGIRLGWQGGINRRSVAELALCMMISCVRQVHEVNLAVRQAEWPSAQGSLLSGRTVGIIGCGHIGQDLVGLLRPFGCDILANDVRSLAPMPDVTFVDLATLLRRSHVVSLHVPLDHTTRGLISYDLMAQMRPGAILINTARGGIVDETALISALRDHHISAAALDVFQTEPCDQKELLAMPNVLVTPHIAGATRESLLDMGIWALRGLDQNRVPDHAWPIPS